MRITSLNLINFQSHVDTTINFSNGFNAIIGASRTGKTSIIRALNFLIFDVFHEDEYVRKGCATVKVKAWFDNGMCLEREKGGNINKLIFTLSDGTTQVYEKFGSDMPDEVRVKLGIFPAKLDSDTEFNLNLAGQDDSAFLITAPASVKTRFLNRLTGTHVVDSALRTLNKEKMDLTADKTIISEDVVRYEKELARFKNLDNISEFIEVSIKNVERIDKLIDDHKSLKSILEDSKNINGRLEPIDTFLMWYNSMAGFIGDVKSRYSTLTSLEDTRRSLKENDDILVNISLELKNIVSERTKLLTENNICPMCGNKITVEQILKCQR